MKRLPLFNNGIWQISATPNGNGMIDPVLFVENLKTGFCDWPIQYTSGHIVYDYPERIPAYIKRTLKSLYGSRKDRWARLEDCKTLV